MVYIFTINPGSTSTKIGLFADKEPVFLETVRHEKEEISDFKRIIDQFDFRKDSIERIITANGLDLDKIDFFVGRGGILKPLRNGLYKVDGEMLSDLRSAKYGEHASNLGALLAYYFAKRKKKDAYILDPVCVDELEPISRITGHPLFKRKSIFHALNHKKTARNTAEKMNMAYEELYIIVVHMGGGISIGLHKKGKITDVNNAIAGEGPFTPERTGGLPLADFTEYVLENKLKIEEVKKMISGKGGLLAYFNTSDFSSIMDLYERKENRARLIIDAMAYQIAKEIGAMATGSCGKIDAIAFTGGLAYSDRFVGLIRQRVSFITDNIFVFAGEDELLAMVEGILNYLKGKIGINKY